MTELQLEQNMYGLHCNVLCVKEGNFAHIMPMLTVSPSPYPPPLFPMGLGQLCQAQTVCYHKGELKFQRSELGQWGQLHKIVN